MALYVYRCDVCGEDLEVARPMDRRDEAPDCPECGQPMRRVPQAPAHRWVGKGGSEVRAPSKGWDWPEGKPFDHAEFYRRNPKAPPRHSPKGAAA